MTSLTTEEIKRVLAALRPTTAADDPLCTKLWRMSLEQREVLAPGELVFRIELPLDLAPTMNRYGSMEGWMQKKARHAVDLRIMAEFSKWPRCRIVPLPRRFVRVVRASSSPVDEATADVIGAKICVDRLVIAGILRGDGSKDLVRAAEWVKAPPKKGGLLVEVRELVSEGAGA